MKKLLALTISLFLVQVYACKHEIPVPDPALLGGNGGNGGGGGGSNYVPCDTTKIYWARDIRPIFTTYCAMYNPNGDGCHDHIRQAENYDFSTYDGVIASGTVDDLNDKLFRSITESDPAERMPKDMPALSEADIDLIRRWILQGADSLYCDFLCDTSNVTFSVSVWPIIEDNCKSCHSGPNPAHNISLTNYAEVASRTQTGQLIGAIKRQSGYFYMPANYSLSPCEIRKIEIWNAAGCPNN